MKSLSTIFLPPDDILKSRNSSRGALDPDLPRIIGLAYLNESMDALLLILEWQGYQVSGTKRYGKWVKKANCSC